MVEGRRQLLKVIILGNANTGKTSLSSRLVRDKFSEDYWETIGADFTTFELVHEGTNVTVQLWDTAGQERYQSMGVAFYRGDGCIITYSITSRASFDAIRRWFGEVESYMQAGVILIVVGMKSDLEAQREVTFEEGKLLAEEFKALFIEASAKAGSNLRQLTSTLVGSIISNHASS
mmetsp:Transcript_5247/g.9633  ORF Transcript_5247/g.9633 Transcript_5247/m.9633 type:complete len:176 (+) Transcript_5247:90-617(+)